MPHIAIYFKKDIVSGELLDTAIDGLIQLVGQAYQENSDYVSAEIISQAPWVRNRKAVDIEIDSSPDDHGLRKDASPDLAAALADHLKAFLINKGIKCEISVWIRIFDFGNYVYRG